MAGRRLSGSDLVRLYEWTAAQSRSDTWNQTAWIEGEDVLRWRAYVVLSERLMQEML